jgi:predicted enzyme related to lactoylglutathione lyase
MDDAQPVPTMGWFATGSDPEGNPIGLWQTDPNAQMPG